MSDVQPSMRVQSAKKDSGVKYVSIIVMDVTHLVADRRPTVHMGV